MISNNFINFIEPLMDKQKRVLNGIIDLCD